MHESCDLREWGIGVAPRQGNGPWASSLMPILKGCATPEDTDTHLTCAWSKGSTEVRHLLWFGRFASSLLSKKQRANKPCSHIEFWLRWNHWHIFGRSDQRRRWKNFKKAVGRKILNFEELTSGSKLSVARFKYQKILNWWSQFGPAAL